MIKKYILMSLLLTICGISCNDITELEKQLNELSFLQQVRAEQYAPELAKKDNKAGSSTVILTHGAIIHKEHSEPNTLALQLKREIIQKELQGLSKEALLASLLEHEKALIALKQKLLPLYETKNNDRSSAACTNALASLCLAGLAWSLTSSDATKVIILSFETIFLLACGASRPDHDDKSLKNSIAASKDTIETIEMLQRFKTETN